MDASAYNMSFDKEQLALLCANYDRRIDSLGAENKRLKAENVKLRKEVEQWHRLTAGIELPEYPITEFKPKDLERENAKLRELAWTLANCAAGHGCDYCPINGGYGYVGEQDMCESVHANMCELGVEVDK